MEAGGVEKEAGVGRGTRREAAAAVVAVAAVLVGTGIISDRQGWGLWVLPWWTWIVVAVPALLLEASFFHSSVRETRSRRRVSLLLLALVVLANLCALLAVVGSLVTERPSGPELLLKAAAVVFTNVVTFALWFWEIDGGGPSERARGRRYPDFQFPQDENPSLAAPGWEPRLVDYVYLSLTNSFAFSPTDAMPLTSRAKLLMAIEMMISIGAIVLVGARAVNVLR